LRFQGDERIDANRRHAGARLAKWASKVSTRAADIAALTGA
jgi:hypothetical protein